MVARGRGLWGEGEGGVKGGGRGACAYWWSNDFREKARRKKSQKVKHLFSFVSSSIIAILAHRISKLNVEEGE